MTSGDVAFCDTSSIFSSTTSSLKFLDLSEAIETRIKIKTTFAKIETKTTKFLILTLSFRFLLPNCPRSLKGELRQKAKNKFPKLSLLKARQRTI